MAAPERDTVYTTDGTNRSVYTRESSSTGWFVGIIVALALLAIGYLVFSANSGPSTTSTEVNVPAVTAPTDTTTTPMTQAPAATEPAPMTEAPAATPAPATEAPATSAPPPATEAAPAEPAPAPAQ